jgi:hypothetical protein
VQNFLRFCLRASRRKPVNFRPWKFPLGACASPLFCTLRTAILSPAGG